MTLPQLKLESSVFLFGLKYSVLKLAISLEYFLDGEGVFFVARLIEVLVVQLGLVSGVRIGDFEVVN